MDHSLINPSQIRHYGIPFLDNQHDGEKAFGIYHVHLFIPFETQGLVIFFATHVPLDLELESHQHTVLTDGEVEWNPNRVEISSNRPYGDSVLKPGRLI